MQTRSEIEAVLEAGRVIANQHLADGAIATGEAQHELLDRLQAMFGIGEEWDDSTQGD